MGGAPADATSTTSTASSLLPLAFFSSAAGAAAAAFRAAPYEITVLFPLVAEVRRKEGGRERDREAWSCVCVGGWVEDCE